MSDCWKVGVLVLSSIVLGTDPVGSQEVAPPAKDARPNVIVILADDFGYECVGANGGSSYSTPHLDRLAAGGARYQHCYTQPLCTPTRAQLLTGQLNFRNYVRFGFLDPQLTTFAHLVKQSGYHTGVFGKWQLGNGVTGPHHFGFDEHVLWQLTRRPPRYANPGLEIDGREVNFKDGEYGPDLVQDAALKFITRHQADPFVMFYPMMLTHAPFQPTPESADWDPQAIGEEINRHPRHFADMVAHLDGHIGQMVEHLERLKLRERTLIVFVGDNGTQSTITSQWKGMAVQGGKGKTTDNGMRVPMILNWPGRIRAGRVVDDLVDTTDILPTICEATKTPPPEKLMLDGRSLLPSATGQDPHPRTWLYSWYWPNQNEKSAAQAPIELARTHHYKLYGDGRFVELDGRYGEVERDPGTLDAKGMESHRLLAEALRSFKEARPEALKQRR